MANATAIKGPITPLKRLSTGLKDPDVARAVRNLEDKLDEVLKRLAELKQ